MRLPVLAIAVLLSACGSYAERHPDVESWGAEKVKGDPDKKVSIDFAKGAEVQRLGPDGGLRIEFERVTNYAKKERVEVAFRIDNRFDDELQFDLGDVRLVVDGEEYSATVHFGLNFRRDARPDLPAKGTKRYAWAFLVPGVVPAGEYDVLIRGARLMTDGGEQPVDDMALRVKVPGRRAGAAGHAGA